MKTLVLALAVAALVALAGGQAFAKPVHTTSTKLTVVMHDPGCHWFSIGGKFKTTATVAGPVKVANYDEAALKVVGAGIVKKIPQGKQVFARPRALHDHDGRPGTRRQPPEAHRPLRTERESPTAGCRSEWRLRSGAGESRPRCFSGPLSQSRPAYRVRSAAMDESPTGGRVALAAEGVANVSTGLPVLDHLVTELARAGRFRLSLEVAPGGADEAVAAAGSTLGASFGERVAAAGAAGRGWSLGPGRRGARPRVSRAGGRAPARHQRRLLGPARRRARHRRRVALPERACARRSA